MKNVGKVKEEETEKGDEKEDEKEAKREAEKKVSFDKEEGGRKSKKKAKIS